MKKLQGYEQDIIERYQLGESSKSIAKSYGVEYRTINRILGEKNISIRNAIISAAMVNRKTKTGKDMECRWKEVVGLEEYYEVSDKGRIYSKRTGTILAPSETGNKGYLKVGISIDGNIKSYAVHSLVAKAFIPNPENKKTINHIDGNKLNNCANNLEWNTNSENIYHAYRTGLMSVSGMKNPFSKLVDGDVREIRKLLNDKKYSHREIAKMYGVTKPVITRINTGRGWNLVI